MLPSQRRRAEPLRGEGVVPFREGAHLPGCSRLKSRTLHHRRPLRAIGLEHGFGLCRAADHRLQLGGKFLLHVRVLHHLLHQLGQAQHRGEAPCCGANKVFQPVPARFTPSSLERGNGRRHGAALVARSRQHAQLRPASCWVTCVSKVSTAIGTCPPMRSVSSGPEPL